MFDGFRDENQNIIDLLILIFYHDNDFLALFFIWIWWKYIDIIEKLLEASFGII